MTLVFRSRKELMCHLLSDNVAINLVKVGRNQDYHNYFVSNSITDKSIISSLDNSNTFPLYIYSKSIDHSTFNSNGQRISNLNYQIISSISKSLKLEFSESSDGEKMTFNSLDIFDYIYAVLYSPTYIEKFKEFLKIDFPRVPYPKNAETFWQLVKLGSKLRQIHLLESQEVNNLITTYPIGGNNEVDKLKYEVGKVWINNEQYFDGVSQVAWEFYIGGYQPAQKWLKDRKGRVLSFEDIMHYQKIIVALNETDRIMKEIDKIDFLP